MADVPGGMAIQGGCLHPSPPRGDSPSIPCHGGRADLCRQCEPPPWRRSPSQSPNTRQPSLERPGGEGGSTREAFTDLPRRGGRSIMDTAGREDNSGVPPNTPFTAIQFFPSPLCTASGPITTHRLPPSPRTPFPAAVALPANNPPMFKSFGRILLETNRRSIRRD
jgi:hypothetical protein